VKAAAEGECRSAERGGPEQLADDGSASGEVREDLVHRDPGRAMARDLGVGEDEVRHAPPVDEGELPGDPAARVVSDECVGLDAKLGQQSPEGAGLSRGGVVVVRRAVGSSEADQVGCPAGEAIAESRHDPVPRASRQRETVQEHQGRSAPVLPPVHGCPSDPGVFFLCHRP
jgi:hypothetical protein